MDAYELPSPSWTVSPHRPKFSSEPPYSLFPPSQTSSFGAGDDELVARKRRHSLGLMRKPLRSSPLAGPALCDEELQAQAPLPSPTRMVSSPNLRSLSTQYDPNRKLSRSASILQLVRRPLRSNTMPASPPPAVPATKHEPSYKAKPPPPLRLNSAPVMPTLPSPPPPSPRHHARGRSRSYTMMAPHTPDLAAFPLPPPTFPFPLNKLSSSQRPSLPTSTSFSSLLGQDGDTTHIVDSDTGDSWLTSLPFQDTPSFSRLGLSAPTLVLPIPAKSANRKSLRGEGGKRIWLAASRSPPSHQLHIVTTARSSSLIGIPPLPPYSPPTPSTSVGTPSLRSSRSPSLSSEGPATPTFSIGGQAQAEDDVEVDGTGKESLDLDPDLNLLSAQVGPELAMTSPRQYVFAQDAESDDAHGQGDALAFASASVPTLTLPSSAPPRSNLPPPPRRPLPPPPPSSIDIVVKDRDRDTASIISDSCSGTRMWLSRPVSIAGSVRQCHRRPSAAEQGKGTSFLWFGSGDSESTWSDDDDDEGVALSLSGQESKTPMQTRINKKASMLLGLGLDNSDASAVSHYSKRSAPSTGASQSQSQSHGGGGEGISTVRRFFRSIGVARRS
ncbi:hypothetical protein C8F01DRAFT_698013 [Mycena amicta]|nr:hypothetical protein C8F01DRAFT_698013 [Mycena amicta]